MKERSIHAGDVNTLNLQRNILQQQIGIHKGMKFPCSCRECDHQASLKGQFAKHQQEIHEGLKFQSRYVIIRSIE